MSQRAQFEESVSQERLTANLFDILRAALLLAAISLDGALAYNVSHRTVEIGVRMAVGAHRSEILRTFLRDSLWMAAIGLGLGIPVAVLVARALRSMLFGLSPLDPMAFCLALTGITTVALLASYIPAAVPLR